MSVNSILKKICEHNPLVLGCMAGKDGAIFREFSGIEGVFDVDAVHESAENIFALMDNLGAGEGAFDHFFLEFHDHSIAARKLDEGVLVLVTKPVTHAKFRKTEVGVNIFVKPLKRALQTAVPVELGSAIPANTPTGAISRLYRSFAA